MDQQRATNDQAVDRPPIMSRLTSTQLSELEEQFDDGDRQQFDERADTYGWTPQQANAVWSWLGAGRGAPNQAPA
ncbi:MAG TPA: hypothetical protein VFI42_00120 [Thermomicrobiaceae bacterium]|jgi:hypothetical protein|nr:hypothetical protein [Thermomicrobiaceae bacterium]